MLRRITVSIIKDLIACFKDNITTPEPTTTTEATTTTSAPLRFPEVALSGDAISPDRIRVTWNRKSKSDQHSSAGLNYVIRYGVKGEAVVRILEWQLADKKSKLG